MLRNLIFIALIFVCSDWGTAQGPPPPPAPSGGGGGGGVPLDPISGLLLAVGGGYALKKYYLEKKTERN